MRGPSLGTSELVLHYKTNRQRYEKTAANDVFALFAKVNVWTNISRLKNLTCSHIFRIDFLMLYLYWQINVTGIYKMIVFNFDIGLVRLHFKYTIKELSIVKKDVRCIFFLRWNVYFNCII